MERGFCLTPSWWRDPVSPQNRCVGTHPCPPLWIVNHKSVQFLPLNLLRQQLLFFKIRPRVQKFWTFAWTLYCLLGPIILWLVPSIDKKIQREKNLFAATLAGDYMSGDAVWILRKKKKAQRNPHAHHPHLGWLIWRISFLPFCNGGGVTPFYPAVQTRQKPIMKNKCTEGKPFVNSKPQWLPYSRIVMFTVLNNIKCGWINTDVIISHWPQGVTCQFQKISHSLFKKPINDFPTQTSKLNEH